MTTDTRERILQYIRLHGRTTAKELQEFLGISRQGLFLQIAKLANAGEIAKEGKSPKVYYFLPEHTTILNHSSVATDHAKFIDKRYLYISPLGEKVAGVAGFAKWCDKTKQDLAKTAGEYMATQQRYDKWARDGVIDGMKKMRATFDKVYLDKLFYLDFYSIERFGKTKLGQLLLYAKQSQNRAVIAELESEIHERIYEIVGKYQIDSVAFIPPTVRREVQLIKELEQKLLLPLRKIKLSKLKSELMVPQKTLTNLNDRIENAARTIVVEENTSHQNILLIDDAVGSGATLNETARQMKKKGIVKGQIIGLAIVGSFMGFDVISEI